MRRLVSSRIQIAVASSILVLASGIGGCSAYEEERTPAAENTGSTQEALAAGVPKPEWLEIAITGLVASSVTADNASTAAASATPAAGGGGTAANTTPTMCTPGEPAGLAEVTKSVSMTANGLLANLFSVVGHITSTPPAAKDDHHAAWGPITSPTSPGIYRLDIERAPDGAIAFQMTGRPKAVDEWRGLFRGVTHVIDDNHRVGEAQVDFGAMHSIDEKNDPTGGSVALKFGNADGNTAIEMTFSGVAGPKAPPTDAHYAFLRRADGAGTFDFVAHSINPAAPAEQLLNVKTAWGPQGAGKASATIVSSSLPKPASSVECWAPDARLVFKSDGATPVGGNPACCPQ